MVVSTRSRSAVAALAALLLSTTALAALPEDAGVELSVTPRAAPPEVQPLVQSTIRGQRFEARDGRVLELLLTDGTSLTLAAGSTLTIDAFDFDPGARTDHLHLTLERGLLRVAGGRPEFAGPVVVTTPAGDASLADGAGLIFVGPDGATRAGLLYGGPLTMTAAGASEEVVRPGFETVTTRGGAPASAARWGEGSIEVDLAALNPGLLAAIAPGTGDAAAAAIDESATTDNTLENVQDELSQTTTPDTEAQGLGERLASISSAGTFGPGTQVGGLNLVTTLPSQTDTGVRSLAQSRDPSHFSREQDNIFADDNGNPVGRVDLDAPRESGATTNHLFNSNEQYTSDLSLSQPLHIGTSVDKTIYTATFGELRYLFFYPLSGKRGVTAFGLVPPQSIVPTPPDTEDLTFVKTAVDFNNSNRSLHGPFLIFDNIVIPQPGIVGELQDNLQFLTTEASGETGTPTTFFGASAFTMLQSKFAILPRDELDGTIWDGYTLNDTYSEVVSRGLDNFLLIEVQPLVATLAGRERLREALADDTFDKNDGSNDVVPKLFLAVFGFEFDPGTSDDNLASLANALADAFAQGEEGLEARINAISSDKITEAQRRRVLEQINSQERFIFAAGDVDQAPDTQRRLDAFFISPGLAGFEEKDSRTVADTVRAFLRNATAFRKEDGTGPLQLADTGLLVIGTPAGSEQGVFGQGGNEQTGVLHADFGISGLATDGNPVAQQSTISATIGQVRYEVDNEDHSQPGEEVVLEARTVASTRDQATIDDGDVVKSPSSVLATGKIVSTSAGGGNDAIGRDGRAGYFVLENYNPPDETGGIERPLTASPRTDGAQEQRFAVLRLATGVDSTQLNVTADERENNEFRGFAAALGEAQVGAPGVGVVALDTGNDPNGFVLRVNPDTNRIEAVYALSGVGTLTMGGLFGDGSRGASVYVDGDRFGARTVGNTGADGTVRRDGADAAMVSGELLRQAATADDDTKAFLDAMPKSQDLKWGFFFGDVASDGPLRRHVHLGTWVAGKVDGSRLPTSGTAHYSGGAIGDVVNRGALYSATGTYESTWNFGSRAGLTALDFDGARMTGFTRQQGNQAAFTGSLAGHGRSAGIVGNFLDGADGVPPPGQIGRFAVSNADRTYNAAGVFGATKK